MSHRAHFADVKGSTKRTHAVELTRSWLHKGHRPDASAVSRSTPAVGSRGSGGGIAGPDSAGIEAWTNMHPNHVKFENIR